MKILHFVSSESYGGIEQHVKELSAFQKSTHEVIIICNEFLSQYFIDEFKVSIVKNFSRHNYFYLFSLYKAINAHNPDIVHTHGSKTTSIYSKIKNFIEASHISTIHNIKSNVKIYNKADHVIAVSNEITKGLDNFSVVTNWIDFNIEEIISNLNKENHALAVGRFEKAKGFDLLIRSWENIERELVIIGNGSEFETLEKLIKDLNLSHKITLKNFLPYEDILNEFAKAKVFILSSRNEGGPRVALEALALKTPVLSTKVGHMSSIFPEEMLVEPNNQKKLKEFLELYVDNIDSLNQESIFKYVREEFSLKNQASKIDEIYKQTLGF
jgi:glycosyltransferase involved in cell wall biosynthesis